MSALRDARSGGLVNAALCELAVPTRRHSRELNPCLLNPCLRLTDSLQFTPPKDCDANGVRIDRRTSTGEPMHFADFVRHRHARRSNLHPSHVLALRLYTTAAFVNLNTPLRQLSPEGDRCAEPHPFPNTVRFIRDAIRQLRTNNAPAPGEGRPGGASHWRTEKYLYRGLKDMKPSADFMERGGSELATLSTTPTLEVALRYAASESPTLIRLRVRSFMDYGADISFCSAFPAESEVVYPPMTYVQPEGEAQVIEGITVVDAGVSVG